MLPDSFRRRLGSLCLLLFFLVSTAPASATEPLIDQVTIGTHTGRILPSECCWMPLPPSDKLAAMKRAEFGGCSAIGGPVGMFDIRDGRLWLTSLFKCSGVFQLREVYPDLAGPVPADWLSGTYTLALDACGYDPRIGGQAYARKQSITVDKGVITSTTEQANDAALCAAQTKERAS